MLLTTIISILAASITGFFCIRWIRTATEQTLTEQLEINLKSSIQEKTVSVASKLSHYEKYIEFISDSITNMFIQEEEMIANGRLFYPPTDTTDYKLSRAVVSADTDVESLTDEILFYSNLESIWEPILKENEGIITSLFLGTNDGLLVTYDRYSSLNCPPEGQEVIYNYYVSEWYKRGIKENDIILTGVYMDFRGAGLTITAASGVKDANGDLVGVIGLDFDISALYSEIFAGDLDEDIFVFALDHADNIISPDSDTIVLKDYTGLTLDELDELKMDADGIMNKHNSVYVCIPITSVGWTLCASVPQHTIQQSIHSSDEMIRKAALVFILIVLVILLIAVVAVNSSVRAITYPLELLGRDIKIISDGDLSYRASVYRNDEIGDITSGMNEMVDRLNFTMNELISSQQHADAMSRLATMDSLTGMQNKTSFDRHSELLKQGLDEGEKEFGFVMLDLNNLKLINDNYGHEKGDMAIIRLCHIICEIFVHSPVFRVGGDEFVVIVKNEDYKNVEALVERFKAKIRVTSRDRSADPWDRVSAAVGYALYNEELDSDLQSVLDRADKEMYQCKRQMKAA